MGRDKNTAAATPKWPTVSKKTGLQADHLGNDIYLVRGCLTPPECQEFVSAAKALGLQHQSSRGPAYGEAFRDNDRTSVQDAALAAHLWQATGLQQLFEQGGGSDPSCSGSGASCGGAGADLRAVGLNPNIRIYRYSPGQRFGKHMDEEVDLGAGEWTRYTLLIYLTSCQGGETVFYGHRGRRLCGVAPQPGLALLHVHGINDCLEHEGAAVTGGNKWVLRSDVVFRPR